MSTTTRGLTRFFQRPPPEIQPSTELYATGIVRGSLPPSPPEPLEERMSSQGAYVSAYLAELAGGAPEAVPEPPRDPSPRQPPPGDRPPPPPPVPPDPGNAGQAPLPAAPPPLTPVDEGRSGPPAPPKAASAGASRRELPTSLARSRAGVERTLGRAGFSQPLTEELTDTALAHTLVLAPHQGLVQAVRSTLAQRVPVAAPLPATGCSIVLVGAGGSGKTTCAAALLAAYRKNSTMPARFATLVHGEEDSALELILSPRLLEPTPADGPRARRELRLAREDGLVVIDTPRLSPSQPAGIRELARLLGELEPDRVVVALPATLGSVAAEQLLAALAPLGASSLVLTHGDETDQVGVGIELACRFGLAPEMLLEHAPAGGFKLKRMDPPELAASVLR